MPTKGVGVRVQGWKGFWPPEHMLWFKPVAWNCKNILYANVTKEIIMVNKIFRVWDARFRL